MLVFPATVLAGPSLELDETTVTLSEPVWEGIKARGEFAFSNTGDSDLIIESVTPG